ncbi:phenylalanine--tRNA ligase subunit beta [Gemella sp. GH3]|uniref:phenylalanine--tRNA ligase subunit beta n=1 Tax=unclassified Gemella TaxID=2624949 RepID=UPI0015D07563|nr:MULTISPECIES: phenylalanine--tRNA ligase subunit beta [unclassified Gemella]MBF0713478.1 phenylalanine--tRNA ligase subunit beta [Gemella sp. GH3.1]NYS50430.1 phenylalanine--tRNA ligase subunit beta [Gemella sp. GH3]
MLVSYKWLQQYVNVEDNPKALADKITRGGLEVEEVIKLDSDLSDIVVGYVIEKEKHPDAEKLSVCKVDIGDEIVQIVCGAKNVDKGQYVIVAKVGAKLPGIKIKKAKLRGVESYGMICSLAELGISKSLLPKNSEEGIYVFQEPQEIGTSAVELLDLDDSIIDISITPNRADALSIRGLVYEVSALYNKKVNFKEKLDNRKYDETNLDVAIKSDKCPNYYGQVIKNIRVGQSPLWLQNKLINSGIRPINNIVDVTNYVLLEYGQPMHAFDKKLLGEKIVIRQATDEEVLTTLDGVERKLTNNDLIISDGDRPVALAGVMGGQNTEVSDSTTDIVLESAYFNPVSVRRTSSYHGLRSDSSARFEKGIDKNLQLLALERAVELIKELCPEAIIENYVGHAKDNEIKQVVVTVSYINNLLGLQLTEENIVDILRSLSFDVIVDGESILVNVPSRRQDITIKQDIAEEVARIYGYNNIPSTLPRFSKSTKGGFTYKQKILRDVRKMYMNVGFMDTINYSLVSEIESKQFSLQPNPTVKLLMPMSENHSTLRQSLIPGLVNTANYNTARRQNDLKLLEIGKVFFGSGDDNIQPEERVYLSVLLTGNEFSTKWLKEEQKIDFYTAKGYLELLFEKLGILEDIKYSKEIIENMHPGRCAKVFYKNNEIGFIGELHPSYTKDNDINTSYVFEIDLDKVVFEEKVNPKYEEISKYPKVTRDIAMLIDSSDEYQNIYDVITNINDKLIYNVELFDIYEGIGLPADKKSIAITLTYSDKDKTLTEEDINKVHNKVEKVLLDYGVTIR